MTRNEIIDQIFRKKSFLCVGLDTELVRLPEVLKDSADPVFEFNKAIIDATHDLAVAFKPNTAFYECDGLKGWTSLFKTLKYIKDHYPDIFVIADAKRGDIGNTSEKYARAFLNDYAGYDSFDAVTVAPYMGEDSVKPFLQFPGKWAILLALTSNQGSADFQQIELSGNNKPLFMKVLEISQKWGTPENLMYVVGATKAPMLEQIRKIVPDHFLLIPGVGAQGGKLEEVIRYGATKEGSMLINASRSVIYASSGHDFAQKAREEALKMKEEMGFWFL